VEEPYRLTPQMAKRIAILGIVAAVLFAVVGFRLWALQVISGDEHLEIARNNVVRTIRVEAPRGQIVDRHGAVLVGNTAGTIVRLWPGRVADGQLDDVVGRLSEVLDLKRGALMKKAKVLANDPLTPLTVKTAVRDDKVAYLSEHAADFPGVEIGTTQLRQYPQGQLAGHLLGFVAEISQEQLDERNPNVYEPGDRIGQAGVERAFDTYLRGEPGSKELRLDADARLLGDPIWGTLPKPGKTIRLTIDAGLQRAAEDALRRGINRAQANGEWASWGGAVIAMDSFTGEIRAMASFPEVDPRLFVGTVDQDKLDNLGEEIRNVPSINRATTGLYPPGSTFKPVTALAAMAERNAVGTRPLLEPDDPIPCTNYFTKDGKRFKNWNTKLPANGITMELPFALAASCDTYFYQLGVLFYALPLERGSPLQYWAGKYGFGEPTGLDIGGESAGLLPDPEYLKRAFRDSPDPAATIWKSGDSIQLAIGQSYLLVTPLQMTRFYAMVANGGKLVTPHAVMQVEEPTTDPATPTVLRRFGGVPPRAVDIDEASLEAVRDGLWFATHDEDYGTSYSTFGQFAVPVSGKTGTAEKYVRLPVGYLGSERVDGRLRDQAWWCGYGPIGKYDYAPLTVCVIVENAGKGGEIAAPVARDVFASYWGVPSTGADLVGGQVE
jgi:penicillin-binding protein 2